jgi:metacaspase-1
MSKRALLIGINEYEDPVVPDLHGCVNDVEVMADMLTGTFGFDEVTRLVQAPATTRAGIFDGLDRLIEATGPGDVAVVYYSGHGSQAPDRDGEEADHLDETIVPSDSGRGTVPVRDIVDDELHSHLSALAAATDRAYFLFDSCHSGSVDRGILEAPGRDHIPAVRSIPPAEDPPVDPPRLRPEARAINGAESASGFGPVGAYVLVAGCLDAQTSKETDFEGRRNGALTHFLTAALLGDGDLTLQAAFDRAVEGVRSAVEDQEPVLEGPAERRGERPF